MVSFPTRVARNFTVLETRIWQVSSGLMLRMEGQRTLLGLCRDFDWDLLGLCQKPVKMLSKRLRNGFGVPHGKSSCRDLEGEAPHATEEAQFHFSLEANQSRLRKKEQIV